MENFEHVLKVNSIVIECDTDTLIHLVRGSSASTTDSSGSEKIKKRKKVTSYQKAKQEEGVEEEITKFVRNKWSSNTIEGLKDLVKNEYGITISTNALNGMS